MLQPTRRGLIAGLATLFAARAIVRASSLMPVKPLPVYATYSGYVIQPYGLERIISATWRSNVPVIVEGMTSNNALFKRLSEFRYVAVDSRPAAFWQNGALA